jgi:hypothetical protein
LCFRSTKERNSRRSARIDRAFGSVAALLMSEGFTAERGETRIASVKRGRRLCHTVLLGLGDASRATPEDLADAAGAAAKVLLAHRAQSAAIYLDDAFAGASLDAADVTHAFVKGVRACLPPVENRGRLRASRVCRSEPWLGRACSRPPFSARACSWTGWCRCATG